MWRSELWNVHPNEISWPEDGQPKQLTRSRIYCHLLSKTTTRSLIIYFFTYKAGYIWKKIAGVFIFRYFLSDWLSTPFSILCLSNTVIALMRYQRHNLLLLNIKGLSLCPLVKHFSLSALTQILTKLQIVWLKNKLIGFGLCSNYNFNFTLCNSRRLWGNNLSIVFRFHKPRKSWFLLLLLPHQ